jgi:hypothetical protein
MYGQGIGLILMIYANVGTESASVSMLVLESVGTFLWAPSATWQAVCSTISHFPENLSSTAWTWEPEFVVSARSKLSVLGEDVWRWLNISCPWRWIGDRGQIGWPPRSPSVTAMDSPPPTISWTTEGSRYSFPLTTVEDITARLVWQLWQLSKSTYLRRILQEAV